MNHKFTVRVTLTHENSGLSVFDMETGVDLTDDEIQLSAQNLAYGLVEDAWGLVQDDEQD